MKMIKYIYCLFVVLPLLGSCTKDDTSAGHSTSVTTLQAINVLNTQADLQGDYSPHPNSQDQVVERGFVFSDEPLSQSNIGERMIVDGTDIGGFYYPLRELVKQHIYYFRAYVLLSNGKMLQGEQMSFTTLQFDLTPAEEPTITSIDIAAADEIDIVIRTPNDYGQNSLSNKADTAATRLQLADIGIYYWVEGKPSVRVPVFAQESEARKIMRNKECKFTLKGLQPNTTYNYCPYIRIGAYFFLSGDAQERWVAYADEVWGQPSTFTTPDMEDPAVQTVQAIPYSNVSQFEGKIFSNGNDRNARYGFYYGVSPDNLDKKLEATDVDPQGGFKAMARQLTILTKYYYKAYVHNAKSEVVGEVKEISTTNVNIPWMYDKIIPYEYRLKNATINSFRIHCELISDGGQPITRCGVNWGTSANNMSNFVAATFNTQTYAFDVEITDLTSGVDYYYKIVIENASGAASSITRNFRTAVDGGKQYLYNEDNAGKYSHQKMEATGPQLTYWELDPIATSLGTFAVLDRSLGAAQTYTLDNYRISSGGTTMPVVAATGYYYQWNRSVPSSSVNNAPTVPLLWDGTHSAVSAWTNSPCPEGYRMLTSDEWFAVHQAIPDQTFLGLHKALLTGITNNRTTTGSLNTVGGGGKYFLTWTSNSNGTTGGYRYFFTTDNPAYTPGVQNPNAALTVRCARKMPNIP